STHDSPKQSTDFSFFFLVATWTRQLAQRIVFPAPFPGRALPGVFSPRKPFSRTISNDHGAHHRMWAPIVFKNTFKNTFSIVASTTSIMVLAARSGRSSKFRHIDLR